MYNRRRLVRTSRCVAIAFVALLANSGCGTDAVSPPGVGATPAGLGEPCTAAAPCPDALTCESSLAGGLCTLGCADSDVCGTDALCRAYDGDAICVPRCSDDADCRDGWACEDVDGSDGATYRVCAPSGGGGTLDVGIVDAGGPDAPAREPNYGVACIDGQGCVAANGLGEQCLSEAQGFVDGYCSAACTNGIDDCGAGALCLPTFSGGLCVAPCGEGDACRDGYECCTLGGGAACLPVDLLSTCTPPGGTEPDLNAPPEPGFVGAYCEADSECDQGAGPDCLVDFGLPICSSDCQTRDDCGEGNRCLQSGQGNFCVNVCESDAGCEDFLVCCDVGEVAVCLPEQFCR